MFYGIFGVPDFFSKDVTAALTGKFIWRVLHFRSYICSMIKVGEVLVSDDIRDKEFVCNLEKCKGACCVEGDYGAPLEESELAILEEIYPIVKPYLSKEGIKAIEKAGCAHQRRRWRALYPNYRRSRMRLCHLR